MIDVLGKLFGGTAKVKILRLFLANKGEKFTIDIICKRTKVQKQTVRKELSTLIKIKLLKSTGTAKNKVWFVNMDFEYLHALESLLLGPGGSDSGFIAKKVTGTGNIKLVVVTGVFVPESQELQEPQIDILIVGDKLTKRKLDTAIADIESSIGRELRFAVFSTEDFDYRMDIGDRLVRDVFDYPHEIIIDRL